MEKELLLEEIEKRKNTKTKHKTKEEKKELYERIYRAARENDRKSDILIGIEECAELTQCITKICRKRMNQTDIAVYEEMSDVKMALNEIVSEIFKVKDDEKEKIIKEAKKSFICDKDSLEQNLLYDLQKISMELVKTNLILSLTEKDNPNVKAWLKDSVVLATANVMTGIEALRNKYEMDNEILEYIEDIKLDRFIQRQENKEEL